MKRLVENVKKKKKRFFFPAPRVFLGWLVKLGAGVGKKGEKDSAPDHFCSSLCT